MAKSGMIKREKKRLALYNKFKKKRDQLKSDLMNKEATLEERFEIQLKINSLPRNSSKSRQRNRCLLTGRPRGYYRRFKMSRIKLRDLASIGQIPGVKKSSW